MSELITYKIDPKIEAAFNQIKPEKDALSPFNLRDFIPKMLKKNNFADRTIGLLNKKLVISGDIETEAFQRGKKAYIVKCSATTNEGIQPFVLYVSIKPATTSRNEAWEDFNNLTYLNEKAKRFLSEDAKKKYQIVGPLTFEDCNNGDDLVYSCFSMPYIPPPYGELHAHDSTKFLPSLFFTPPPLLQLSLEETNEAMQINHYQKNNLLPILANYLKKGEKPSRDSVVYRQLEDILLGNALIYLLADNRFPQEFLVNAGDWMFSLNNSHRFNLCLISVRGGFTPRLEEKDWIEMMKNHQEHDEYNIFFPLFPFLDDDIFERTLQKAKKMFKKNV